MKHPAYAQLFRHRSSKNMFEHFFCCWHFREKKKSLIFNHFPPKKLKVPPNKCWMIGDNPRTDIIGARALGITTIQKRHDGVVVYDGDDGPDIAFDSFEDLHSELIDWGWLDE